MSSGSDFLTSAFGKEIGLGAVLGFASGYATKQIGRFVLFAGGVAFIGYQGARSQGWVGEANWQEMNNQLIEKFDANGDGKLDMSDAQTAVQALGDKLGFGVPGAGSFTVGFVTGFWMG